MSSAIYPYTELTPTETERDSRPKYESALRVAAGTLCQASSGEISATTVVCVVDEPDTEMFGSLVADIATEWDLDAEICARDGAFSVRFSRPIPDCAPHTRGRGTSLRLMVARLMGLDGARRTREATGVK